MKLLTLVVLSILTQQQLAAQTTPLEGQIALVLEELAFENRVPSLSVSFSTVGHYGCDNYGIATRQRRHADTVDIEIVGLTREEVCTTMLGPARTRVPLSLQPGTYTLRVTRDNVTDGFELIVSPTHLFLRGRDDMRFIVPDTSVFLRPHPRSFFVSCGTPDVSGMCSDLDAWLRRQNGLIRRSIADDTRIAFQRGSGYRHHTYFLYEYSDEQALSGVRRCMRHLADLLSQTVGAGITLQTADGEVIRAFSRRSFHEPHAPVPRRISGSPDCP